MTITISLYCILFFLLNAFFDDISGPIIKPAVYNFLFTLIEYIMFSILLSQGYNKNKKFIKIVIIFSILFICFHTIYFLSTEQGLIGSVPIGVYTVLIFAYIFIYFYLELRGDQTNGSLLISQPVFWVALGILVYLSGTFFFPFTN
jgi:hypothetical protein